MQCWSFVRQKESKENTLDRFGKKREYLNLVIIVA